MNFHRHHGSTAPGQRRGFNRTMLALSMAGFAVVVASIGLGPHWGKQETPSSNEISRGPTGRHRLAVTFDAGGESDQTIKLLTALENARIRCTFFVTGHWASTHPEFVREILARGHEIGNHSWSHPDLTRLDDAGVRSEILHAETLLTTLAGRSPRPLFRAPYGARNARILRILGELGYTSIYWTLDSLDSNAPQKSPQFLVSRVTRKTDAALDGSIILMHVGEPSTVEALPEILADFHRRGFRMGTISELLSEP